MQFIVTWHEDGQTDYELISAPSGCSPEPYTILAAGAACGNCDAIGNEFCVAFVWAVEDEAKLPVEYRRGKSEAA